MADAHNAGCVHRQHPCEAHLVACKDAVKSCEEVQHELREKEKVIFELQCQLAKCKSKEREMDLIHEISQKTAENMKLNECLNNALAKQQRTLRESSRFGNCKENNEPIKSNCAADSEVQMSDIQKEIVLLRKQLDELTSLNTRQDGVRNLQNQLALKDCEISKLKNKSCLSAASMLDGSIKGMSDRSWNNDCRSGGNNREHCILQEELKRLSSERDNLKRCLDNEVEKFAIEREALNNTLDKLKDRLECVEHSHKELLEVQEPKNKTIEEMRCSLKHLHCEIEVLRDNNQKLQCELSRVKKDNQVKDEALEKNGQQLCEMDMKLKQTNRKLQERSCEESKLMDDINRVNAELRKCRENYQSLEATNTRISVGGK